LKTNKKSWEASYSRKENFIYFPKEEIIKFLNRFIKKKISLDKYRQILKSNKKLRALDFGCGIGRSTILLKEFDIDGYGIDISENAIQESKKLSKHLGFNKTNFFKVFNGEKIQFKDNFFDFTISDCVLDSMSFDLAKQHIKEIDRVTKKYFFLSLISENSNSLFKNIKNKNLFDGEIEITEKHEKGTIQSFFSIKKINYLIMDTNFKIISCEHITTENIMNNKKMGRYYLVLEKVKFNLNDKKNIEYL